MRIIISLTKVHFFHTSVFRILLQLLLNRTSAEALRRQMRTVAETRLNICDSTGFHCNNSLHVMLYIVNCLKFFDITFYVDVSGYRFGSNQSLFNTLRTGDADLRF